MAQKKQLSVFELGQMCLDAEARRSRQPSTHHSPSVDLGNHFLNLLKEEGFVIVALTGAANKALSNSHEN